MSRDENSGQEFVNKTWVHDFKGEVKDAQESEIDQKATFDPDHVSWRLFLHKFGYLILKTIEQKF